MKNANKINLNNSNLDYNTMNISSLDEGIENTATITTSRKRLLKLNKKINKINQKKTIKRNN